MLVSFGQFLANFCNFFLHIYALFDVLFRPELCVLLPVLCCVVVVVVFPELRSCQLLLLMLLLFLIQSTLIHGNYIDDHGRIIKVLLL